MTKKQTFQIIGTLNRREDWELSSGSLHTAYVNNFLSDRLWQHFGIRPGVHIKSGTIQIIKNNPLSAYRLLMELVACAETFSKAYGESSIYRSFGTHYDCYFPFQIGVSIKSGQEAYEVSHYSGYFPLVHITDEEEREVGCNFAMTEEAFLALPENKRDSLKPAQTIMGKRYGPLENVSLIQCQMIDIF